MSFLTALEHEMGAQPHVMSQRQWIDNACENCILLNKEYPSAIPFQSMHHG